MRWASVPILNLYRLPNVAFQPRRVPPTEEDNARAVGRKRLLGGDRKLAPALPPAHQKRDTTWTVRLVLNKDKASLRQQSA